MPRVVSLTFNLDPSVADGSLALRKNLTTQAPWPEWQRGRPNQSASSPVAYVLSELGEAPPRLNVQVERQADDPARVEFRALATTTAAAAPLPPAELLPPDLIWPGSYWFSSAAEYHAALAYRAYYRRWQDSRQVNPHVLGRVPATEVAFPEGNATTAVTVPLPEARLRGRGVGVFDITWRWQTRAGSGLPWKDIGLTNHRVYTVLGLPTAPWHPLPQAADDTQIAWVDALDVACRWAAGANEIGEAAAGVTQAVNGLGAALIEYGCPIGALTMYASPFGLDAFDCTSFLELLNGGDGNGRYVNCTDCATIVSTFANLLGCDLWQSRMGSYQPAFLTNPILAIGSTRLGSPCGWGLGFTYHEVAWEGACTSDDDVYDACVRLVSEQEGSGVPGTAVPAGIRFGAEGDGQYRDLIAAPTSRAVCVPRPGERKRRVLL
jgi:hypothetical protein